MCDFNAYDQILLQNAQTAPLSPKKNRNKDTTPCTRCKKDVPSLELKSCGVCSQEFCMLCTEKVKKKKECGGKAHVFDRDFMDAIRMQHQQHRRLSESAILSSSLVSLSGSSFFPPSCHCDRCGRDGEVLSCIKCKKSFCSTCAGVKTFKNPCIDGSSHTFGSGGGKGGKGGGVGGGVGGRLGRTGSLDMLFSALPVCERCAELCLGKLCLRCHNTFCDKCCRIRGYKNVCINGMEHLILGV